ncbi:MAG TPA: 3-hydroxyacyl-CoA dehydrogenase family protein [Isosphaeraceae bacterium]|nr:3-hydroxyacyl-CoA dehydrogenase family protein [Isosphaeraceae bacterium]
MKPINGIRRVAVLGLGTMGHGIAQTFALAGYDVACYDASASARASLIERVRANLAAFVAAELVEPEQVGPTLARLHLADTEDAAVAGVQFLTEAVPEDLALKQDLLARLERTAAPETILASNSSSFPISQSGRLLHHPQRALVTHWFNPPHLTPVVEVVPSPLTSGAVVQTTMQILARIGKVPIPLRRELPGFLVNRVQVAIQREVWDLVDQGVATRDEIDAAIRGTVGFRFAVMGPLEIHDFAGLDIQLTTYRNLVGEIRSETSPPTVLDELVGAGHLGIKSGRGFYDYPPERLVARRTRRDSLLLRLWKLLYHSSSGEETS